MDIIFYDSNLLGLILGFLKCKYTLWRLQMVNKIFFNVIHNLSLNYNEVLKSFVIDYFDLNKIRIKNSTIKVKILNLKHIGTEKYTKIVSYVTEREFFNFVNAPYLIKLCIKYNKIKELNILRQEFEIEDEFYTYWCLYYDRKSYISKNHQNNAKKLNKKISEWRKYKYLHKDNDNYRYVIGIIDAHNHIKNKEVQNIFNVCKIGDYYHDAIKSERLYNEITKLLK